MNLVLIGWVNLLILFDTALFAFSYGIQLEKFKELRHHLRSGPIVIVNQNTFFIPNLHYDGGGYNAHFWIGNGSEPNENGILVQDETGSNGTLKVYKGENVYIVLPGGLSTKSIEYFGIWCIDYKQNFGYVTIPKNIVVPPTVTDYRITTHNEFIIRVQKCCSITQSMDHDYKCVRQNQKFHPNVYTRVGSVEYFVYEPFINSINCTGEGKLLNILTDTTRLFLNGTILKGHLIWNQDEYCMETFNLNNQSNPVWKSVAVICKSHTDTNTLSVFVLLSMLTVFYI